GQCLEPRADPAAVLRDFLAATSRPSPGGERMFGDVWNADAVHDLSKNRWAIASHLSGVAFHDAEVGAHERCEIGVVDQEKVGLRDPGAAFPRDLVATRHVDDVDREVGQLAAELSGEVVAPAFYEQEFRMKPAHQLIERIEILADVVSHSGVRTA